MPIQLVTLKNQYHLIVGEELVEVPLPQTPPPEDFYFNSNQNPDWVKEMAESDLIIHDEETLCPYFCKGGDCQDKQGVFVCCQNYYYDFITDTEETKNGLELNYWRYTE